MRSDDFVTERLEKLPQKLFAAATRQTSERRFEWNRRVDERGPLLARAGDRAPKHPRERDAEKRRRGVGTIVDVRLERLPFAAITASARERDGIDLDHQRRGAAVVGRFRIENVHTTKPEIVRLRARRVLVKQKPEVRRRPMCGRDREQHDAWMLSGDVCAHPSLTGVHVNLRASEAEDFPRSREVTVRESFRGESPKPDHFVRRHRR